VETNYLIYSKESPSLDKDGQKQSPAASSIAQITTLQRQEQEQQSKSFNCFYCDQSHSSDKERVIHIQYQHPGKMLWPTPEAFEKRLLQ
jgi:hypothetical protein